MKRRIKQLFCRHGWLVFNESSYSYRVYIRTELCVFCDRLRARFDKDAEIAFRITKDTIIDENTKGFRL